MRVLKYNDDVINDAIYNLRGINDKFPLVADTIKSKTSAMTSCKGFGLLGSGVTSTSFSSVINENNNKLQNLVRNVKTAQTLILSYNGEGEPLGSLDGLSNEMGEFSGEEAFDSYNVGEGKKIKSGIKSLAATLFTAGAGVVEGLAELVETGADLLCLGKSAVSSVFTGTYDLITGSDTTKKMWEDTKAIVSEKKVENAFNNFYENNEFGKSVKENAIGFDTVRGIASGVGYTTGLIGLNVVTGGLASGLGIGAAGTVGVGQLAATAGVMGFSSGTENAWADGASIKDGLLYGAANGAWEGAQWYIGGKINQYGGVGDKVASGIFKGGRAGAATRVALDAADSGLEGFVQPALTMIYKDYDGTNLSEKYKAAFNQAGGWANVRNQAILGGMMSAGSEFFDARKILKSDGKASADTSTPDVKAAGTSSTEYKYSSLVSDDVFERELMEANMAANGDFSRHSRSTIDGDYIRTVKSEFNKTTTYSGVAPDGAIKFMDGSYVPSGQNAGSLLGKEVYYNKATFDNLLEQNRQNLSGYEYSRYKKATEIFASHGKSFNMTELKLILNHSEGNVNRIKSAITMSDSTLTPQNLDGIANELAKELFPSSSRGLGANVERGIINIFIDGQQARGTDTWKSGAVLFDDFYTVDKAMKNMQNATVETKVKKINDFFGNGRLSDDMVKKLATSDGYPETITKILLGDSNIPEYQVKVLSESIATKVFTAENAARIKAQYEVLNGNYSSAKRLVSNSGADFEATAALLRSSETFSQRAKRFAYYNAIDSAINMGSTKADAMRQAKLMYGYAMDQVGTKTAKESAANLFSSKSDYFGYVDNMLTQFNSSTVPNSPVSQYLKDNFLINTTTVNRTEINARFDELLGIKTEGYKPFYVDPRKVDVTRSADARTVFKNAYINAAMSGKPVESLKVMTKLLELENNGQHLYVYNNGGLSCSHRCKDTINLAIQTIDAADSGTVFHETGHYLFDHVLHETLPTDLPAVRDLAVKNLNSAQNAQLLKDVRKNLTEVKYFADYKSSQTFKASLEKKGFSSVASYKEYLIRTYNMQTVNERADTLLNSVKNNGKMYTSGYETDFKPKFDYNDALNCANIEINQMKSKARDAISRNMGSYTDISGMIDSLTMSKENIWYGHTREYFEGAQNPLRNVYHELIADYTSLRVRGETSTIGLLRQLFGNEMMDMLETTYQGMLK